MKIAIYKPYKTIYWNDIAKDTNVWSRECVNFSKLLADNGHEVYLLSTTDYQNTYKNVHVCLNYKDMKFDVLVVFNGAFSRQSMSEETVLKDINTNKTILLGSDLDLLMQEHNHDLYDIILTATPERITKNAKYGSVQDYHMYKETIYKGGWEIRKKQGLFIGQDRHKIEKFMEYIFRPNIDFFGKCQKLNIDKIIPRNIAYDLLRQYLYSIVFFDNRVNDIGFVTARPLELMLFGLIPFVDSSYDKYELQFKKDSYLRVNNYEEFYEKTQNLNKQQFLQIQQEHFDIIEKIIKNETAYNLFMKYVEG